MTMLSDDDILRLKGVEIVDDRGRVRITLGPLGGSSREEPVFGIAIHDEEGSERMWLTLDAEGPTLVFASGGTGVIYIGVDDPVGDTRHPGAYINIGDATGRVTVGWRVTPDGSISQEGAQ